MFVFHPTCLRSCFDVVALPSQKSTKQNFFNDSNDALNLLKLRSLTLFYKFVMTMVEGFSRKTFNLGGLRQKV